MGNDCILRFNSAISMVKQFDRAYKRHGVDACLPKWWVLRQQGLPGWWDEAKAFFEAIQSSAGVADPEWPGWYALRVPVGSVIDVYGQD